MILLPRDIERSGDRHHRADRHLARLGREALRPDGHPRRGGGAGHNLAAAEYTLVCHSPSPRGFSWATSNRRAKPAAKWPGKRLTAGSPKDGDGQPLGMLHAMRGKISSTGVD